MAHNRSQRSRTTRVWSVGANAKIWTASMAAAASVAQAQGIPRDMEGVEAVMVESTRWPLHDGVCRHETTSCCATKTWIIPITSEIEIDRSIELWLMEV